MLNNFSTTRIVSIFMLCAITLGGCKEVLYSGLPEEDANEMVAVLASQGIEATRVRDKKGIYEISVETVDIPAAVTLLKESNLPREKFMSFGDVFSAEGIISTPFEQHARYVHALNQELSHTLTDLENIRSARVLITSPPQGRYDRTPPPATASVTIEYAPGKDLSQQVSAIKSIVAHSVPNLDYDDVAIALFPAGGPQIDLTAPPSGPDVNAAGIFPLLGSGSTLLRQIILLFGIASFCAILFLLFRRQNQSKDAS